MSIRRITQTINPRAENMNTRPGLRRMRENTNESRRPSSIWQSSGFVISRLGGARLWDKTLAKWRETGAATLLASPQTPVSRAVVAIRRFVFVLWLFLRGYRVDR